MNNDKNFWDNIANKYNAMFAKSKAYKKMYALMENSFTVLEVGTASGLVAREIAGKVNQIYAIDISDEMIEQAKKISQQNNIIYSVQDSTSLDFDDNMFDVVIIANVLHIVDSPEKCLSEIKRVLKNNGILIAPTFMWKEINWIGKIEKFIMLRRNFPIYSYWNTDEFIDFLANNGFACIRQECIKNSFNICYVECESK